MKTALRRSLEHSGWQAAGFLIALGVFACIVFLWGQHIEGRIDTVVVQRQHDHRTLHRLVVHDAEEAQSALKQPPAPAPSGSGTDAPSSGDAPSVPDQSSGVGQGTSDGTKAPPKSSQPSPQAEFDDETADTPTVAIPVPSSPSPPAEPPRPHVIPSTVEAAGGVVQRVVGQTLCTATALLPDACTASR